VYTTDPNITSRARRLNEIAFEEMLEMASLGAKVLHIRGVELAMNQNVPLRVLSSFEDGEGTLVLEEGSDMEKQIVSAVTCSAKEAKITLSGLQDRPGVAARLFTPLADANIVVDMIIQNASADGVTDISFTIPEADLARALQLVEKFQETLGIRSVTGTEDIAKVSIVGSGMRSHSGVAAKMFTTLANEGVNIEMISTSEIKISCVIQKKYAELAVRALHDAFELSVPSSQA
jgi:aspartate kinase